ncbi:hemerythrin domain-containing protein [Roseateles violae]|uniref:Hemerythrin domain-containing protein n=1 Tax=Roseateles violae TaxID=3058042 RepID=A0ABT8E0A3_9BURK|nr:hemerythrin domain-containing protein [Pelomonas sp. PFR6]MDN3923276.1 hemerythrin domain-containing protein [Pelomonas sp. PFR6]
MSTSAKAGSKSKSGKATPAGDDAITLLKGDHKEVKAMFKSYQKLVDDEADGDEKQSLAEQICAALSAHASVEEEIFYPAAREVLGDDADLVDEADVEHGSAKDLIAQIQAASPEDDHYDAKVKVLGEYIDHHVKEEEGEMFPRVAKSDLDLDSLGEEMAARKDELLAELSGA